LTNFHLELLARPGAEPGTVEVGGRVALDDVREIDLDVEAGP
jgi:hypothetical protein